MENNRYIYDIELYKNLFLVIFFNISEQRFHVFEISPRKDDRDKLVLFLRSINLLIGFNNLSFDYPVLHEFGRLYPKKLTGKKLVNLLFNKGQQLINSNNRWSNAIKKPYIPQVDLFLINHYDNFAKATNLKVLEFNMQMDNIQELPYPFDSILTDNQIDDVISYCKNDVEATYKFYQHNIPSIEFRQRMSNLYNHDFTNYNDVKIGERILLDEVSKQMNTDIYTVKQMRTYRESMLMNDIIFPYIKFKTEPFKALLDWWRPKTITETKGQFNRLDLEDVSPLLPYCNPKTEKGKLKNLNIILDGFQFDFGTGGLHGALKAGIWKEDDENEIILLDVSSYYPNLAYHNKLHPQHIPVEIFTQVIGKLYKQRMLAKEDGDIEMVKAIKLALNGALYGKSNSEYSFMYDPQFMMSICVNGQLLLSMLAEQCILHGFELIQVNTDGVLIRLPRSKRAHLDNIVQQWMELTNLKLDYDFFKMIVQRDVNNYLGVYRDNSLKLKGAFDYKYAENGDWHKNFSAMVIPKALKAYYVDNIQPEHYVNQADIYDFFLRTKYNKSTKLIKRIMAEDGNIINTQLQNVTRYYVATDGFEFIKIMPPLKGKEEKGEREFAVEAEYLCMEMNKIYPNCLLNMRQNINYQYYIDKIRDIINLIGTI